MARSYESPIRVYVHGERNQVAEFEGGPAELDVGGMAGPSYAGEEDTVLLTVEGLDTSGKAIDIEIAVPISQIQDLINQILDCSKPVTPVR